MHTIRARARALAHKTAMVVEQAALCLSRAHARFVLARLVGFADNALKRPGH